MYQVFLRQHENRTRRSLKTEEQLGLAPHVDWLCGPGNKTRYKVLCHRYIQSRMNIEKLNNNDESKSINQ